MSKYVNPIPYIDKGKKFEMRIRLESDELVDVEVAKEEIADFILGMDKETLMGWINCTKIYAVYPDIEEDVDEKKS